MQVDEQCVLMLDKFPKARHHALVLPRCARLQDLTSLTAEDVPLLDHMEVRTSNSTWCMTTSWLCCS